ncbi:MAG: hypothetical protein NTW28_33505 [Candidatus Solibacter sp.]|nr:hypothetical protein [Candidatus Solibacter sp.]
MNVSADTIRQATEAKSEIAEAAKLGTTSPYIAAPERALTCLVTDGAAAPSALAPHRAPGVTVVVWKQ